jgi:hypothetical protein
MTFLLKIIPIYTIWHAKITQKDIFFTGFVFIVYLLWMFINKQSTYDFINNTKKLIIYNKNTLPGIILLEKMGL